MGSRMFLDYMSVHQWGAPGHWTLNYSGMAYSDDGGQNWVKSSAIWPGNSNFGQVAMVPQGSYVYLFGIPGGRYGALQLARVAATSMLNISAYQYWNGLTWGHRPAGGGGGSHLTRSGSCQCSGTPTTRSGS